MSTAKSKKMQAAAPALVIDWPRTVLILLGVAGLFVAGYLAWAELTGNDTICGDAGKLDCSAVQNSAYAETLGFPVAVMGFLGFVAILGVVVLEDQIDLLATYGRTLVAGMALFGVIFQAYLTVIEATVLDAWCQWCIASFVIITLVLVVSAYRLYDFLKPLQK